MRSSRLTPFLIVIVGFLTVCPVLILVLGSFSKGFGAFGQFTLEKYISAYTDPAVFAWERDVIFGTEWVCVGRVEQLANPGDHLAADVIDQPILVTRATDGRLHAISNVCLHRSMPLVDGPGSSRWIVCPYHQWSYDLDGSLHSAPPSRDMVNIPHQLRGSGPTL